MVELYCLLLSFVKMAFAVCHLWDLLSSPITMFPRFIYIVAWGSFLFISLPCDEIPPCEWTTVIYQYFPAHGWFFPPFLQVILNDAVVDILAPVGPGSGLNLGAHLLGLWECENPTLQENAGCPPRCWPQFRFTVCGLPGPHCHQHSVIGLPNRGREVALWYLVTVSLAVGLSTLSYVCLSFFPLKEMPSCVVGSFCPAGAVYPFLMEL